MSVSAFTSVSTNGLLGQLVNTATLKYNDNEIAVNALWDTGASKTCISKEAVQALELVALGKQKIRTPSGESEVSNYLIDILLPNNLTVRDISVCDSEIGSQGIGVLIGMDIITLGDFAVSNLNSKTVFSFRTPSLSLTDYVGAEKLKQVIGSKHGKGKRKKK